MSEKLQSLRRRIVSVRRTDLVIAAAAAALAVVISVVVGVGVGVGVGGGRDGAPAAPLPPVPGASESRSGVSALFVGDSYTAGPSSMEEFGYPCVASTILGWGCNVGAVPGTGYINGGAAHRVPRVLGALEQSSTSLSERFLRLRETDRADVVVLDAGRNDLQYGPLYMANMFIYTLRRAKESWPDSRIAVVAPWFIDRTVLDVPGSPGLTISKYLEDTLRSFPEFDDVVFVDPGSLGWFAGTDVRPYLSPDGIHPNIAGHKLIGEMLAKALREKGLAAPSE